MFRRMVCHKQTYVYQCNSPRTAKISTSFHQLFLIILFLGFRCTPNKSGRWDVEPDELGMWYSGQEGGELMFIQELEGFQNMSMF